MLLKEWCLKYIKEYKSISLKQSTYDSYLRYCDHINLQVDISTITLSDIQSIITKMYAQDLTRSTINHTLTIIRQALNKAYMLGLTKQIINYKLLELPRASSELVPALSEREVKAILEGPYCYYKDLFCFLLLTGLRIGEAIALQIKDIDLKNKVFYVKNTDYAGNLQKNKSNRSRAVPITLSVERIIKRHLHINKNARLFLNRNNKPCIYSTVRDAWYRYCDEVNINRYGLHALRHTFATLTIRAGGNIKAVSQILGHADVSITLKIYTDISPEQKRHAVNALETSLTEAGALILAQ